MSNRKPIRERGGRAAHAPAAAFTLIELMVVVALILVLVGILVPTLVRIRVKMLGDASFAVLATLQGGCEMYRTDFGKYPPSGQKGMPPDFPDDDTLRTNDVPNAGIGGSWLVECLTGYKDKNSDGADGFGFRTVARGPVYGPYAGAEKLAFSGTSTPWFLDAFQHPILYYRFDNRSHAPPNQTYQYWQVDNAITTTGVIVSVPGDVNAYAKQANSQYYRSNYLLISPGADGVFVGPATNPRTDDITNFYNQ